MDELRFLLRQVFYFRLGLGQKVEEVIAEKDVDLWKRIWKAIEEPSESEKN